MSERCAICGCPVHRDGDYAQPTVMGRSHATRHHYVAERFFGRSKNRAGTQREAIFPTCPWQVEGRTSVFCYECHEELLHNPVLLPEDVDALAHLVRVRGCRENAKTEDRMRIGERIKLLHEVIEAGLQELLRREKLRRGG